MVKSIYGACSTLPLCMAGAPTRQRGLDWGLYDALHIRYLGDSHGRAGMAALIKPCHDAPWDGVCPCVSLWTAQELRVTGGGVVQ